MYMANIIRRSLFQTSAPTPPLVLVNHLIGTATQYIDTGLTGTKYNIEIKCKATSMPSNGVLPWGTTNGYLFLYATNGVGWNTTGSQITVSGIDTMNFRIYNQHYYNTSLAQLYIDGADKGVRGTQQTTGALYLFKASGYMDRQSRLSVEYCKIWTYGPEGSQTLLRDFVPALYNGRPGLYDRQNDVMYYSMSGDDFSYD